jgi:hypothetical protein
MQDAAVRLEFVEEFEQRRLTVLDEFDGVVAACPGDRGERDGHDGHRDDEPDGYVQDGCFSHRASS